MRIIAGKYKGRTLLPPRGLVTRPITSRVKVALFNILGEAPAGAVVADLFCGTGSLGLEALSRGARYCCFAERDRPALARLERNIEAIGLADRCRIWRGDVMRHLRRRLEQMSDPVDLAFVDPPYSLSDRWRWDQVCERLFGPLGESLSDAGVVVFRCRRNIDLPRALGPLCVCDKRDYGKMALVFLKKSRDAGRSEMKTRRGEEYTG